MIRSNLKPRLSKPHCGGPLLILALIFTLLAATDLWANPTAAIRLKERVESNDADILLGQIATIEGADTRFNQRLKDILIAKAPLPGDTRQIDPNLVQKRLKQHHIDLKGIMQENQRCTAVKQRYKNTVRRIPFQDFVDI